SCYPPAEQIVDAVRGLTPVIRLPPRAGLALLFRRGDLLTPPAHPRGTYPTPPGSTMSSTTLTLSHLAVTFGARTLVTGLDLTVSDGDVVALVGPNGSGKSSLMRTVVGELPVES